MTDLTTQTLGPDDSGLRQAASLLAQGALVAFPTETVYGLGADARDDTAVAKIFSAKGRPRFNPLIVHVASVTAAQSYVEWDAAADTLAQRFWPGPLTLVLPLKEGHGLSPLVTAGLPTLAIRVPAHPIGHRLLELFGGPVAAPSANPSGKISPTLAAHVLQGLSGRIDAVVDGGACGVGLESTILGLDGPPTILRHGGVSKEDIETALGTPVAIRSEGAALNAPGQMTSHYAPGAPVRLNVTELEPGERLLGFGDVECDLNLSASADLIEAAANLFHHLHYLDQSGDAPIAVSPVPETGLGRAINDRLRRAAAPRP